MRRFCTAFIFICSSAAFGQLLQTNGKVIVNDQGHEILLRGFGLGGWQIMEGYMMQTSGIAGSQHEIKENLIALMGVDRTEEFFQKWRMNHFTKQDVDSLASWGFNSVRVPMHYNLFTLPIEEEPISGAHTWLETGFQLIDSVLKWSRPHGIYVILDLHAAPGGQGTSSEINDYDPEKPSLWESNLNKEKTVALWTRIADRYKNEPWIGGYDLINEPHWDLPGNTALRQLYGDITDGIRSVDPNHIIFIEGNWYANDFTGLTPPWDDQLVYSFHKYWSFNNPSDLDWVLPLRGQYDTPLWMGEAGENSNTWFADAVNLFEANNIGWAWWAMRKIGDIDSPYAVDINQGYQKIIDYWKGEGPKPTEQEAFEGMMQMADNLLVENSRYRKDIPDALIRQPHTDETLPYVLHEIPGIIYMSDFDLGKNGIAYYDKDVADYNLSTGSFQAWNSGWSYRNDGVDIQANSDPVSSNGFHVAFTEDGEWINYTVDIKSSGAYQAKVRLASALSDSKFHLAVDNQSITSSQIVANSGGWDVFQTHIIDDILLEEGQHVLGIHFDQSAVNVSSIQFNKLNDDDDISFTYTTAEIHHDERSILLYTNKPILESSISSSEDHFEVEVNGTLQQITQLDLIGDRTIRIAIENTVLFTDKVEINYDGSTIRSVKSEILSPFRELIVLNHLDPRYVLPGRIEAENFENQSGLRTEETTDDGGGLNIGYTDVGDYADYKVYVRNNGSYHLKARVAAPYQTGTIGLYIVDEASNEFKLSTLSTPVTNGWQSWETIDAEVELSAGPHTLRMKVLAPGFNLNWIEIAGISLEALINEKDDVFIYPNPVQSEIHVRNSHNHNFLLMDLKGSVVLEGVVPDDGIIPLNGLIFGNFVLRLENSRTGTMKSYRLVIDD